MSEPSIKQTQAELADRIHVALETRDGETLKSIASDLVDMGDDEFANELFTTAYKWDNEDMRLEQDLGN